MKRSFRLSKTSLQQLSKLSNYFKLKRRQWECKQRKVLVVGELPICYSVEKADEKSAEKAAVNSGSRGEGNQTRKQKPQIKGLRAIF